MDYSISPILKVQSVSGAISNTAANTNKPNNKSQVAEIKPGKPKVENDVFARSQETDAPMTFGDKFLKATKETMQEIKDSGTPLSNVNSKIITASILVKMQGYDKPGSNKLDYVI